ncbi:hypothetical protein PTKIN_Ptkin16aG0534500 [Pterospermum kingtungense]
MNILHIFFIFLLNYASAKLGNETDLLSLLAFKEEITEDPSKVLSPWNSSVNFCNWHGVTWISILAVADNKLTGRFPRTLGTNFPNLQILAAGVNRFTGPIPPALSNAAGLVQIDFPDNYFVGKMPSDLGSIKNLQRLNVGRSRLGNGEASDLMFLNSWTNCSKLQLLRIDNNRFGGVLPNFIGNFSTALKTLLARHNQIHGSIPSGIVNLVNLNSLFMEETLIRGLASLSKSLNLARNSLNGTLPQEVGNLINLKEFDVSGNRLNGNIPSTLGNCLSLKHIFTDNNLFHGSIPSSLTSLKGLMDLDLSRNNLSGQIPEFLQGFVFCNT